MYLETDRLIVRSIQPSDEKAFVEMASDGSLWEIFGDCSECHMWMGEWITDAMKMEKMNNPFQEYLAFVIVDKDSQEVMGSVGSSFYEDFNEVGVTYFIGAKYRGHGYATEALRALVGYLYTTYEMNRLVATASVQNPASCKTLENAGFVLVETKMYQEMYDECATLSNIYEHLRKPMDEEIGFTNIMYSKEWEKEEKSGY